MEGAVVASLNFTQDLMVIDVFSYSASHPCRSAVTHGSQVYTMKLFVIKAIHMDDS